MAVWSSRLTAILGKSPTELGFDDAVRLGELGVREDTDVDFKRGLYGNSDADKQALAGDVAAMANERGGVLLLGIEEHDGAAAATPGVDLSDRETVRMRQIVTSLCAPHVPCDILPVASREDPARGVYVIVIPPSALRPHAVATGRNLRFPRRDGASTRYMPESELADLYRARFRSGSDQQERLKAVTTDGWSALDWGDRAPIETARRRSWLGVSVVPEHSGRMELSVAALQGLGEWIRPFDSWRAPVGFFGGRARLSTGVRRLTASTTDAPRPSGDYAELHTDGAVFAAAPLEWASHLSDEPIIVDADLLFATIGALRMAGAHAVGRTGSFGDALLRVQVRAPADVMLVANASLANWGRVEAPDRNVTVRGEITSTHTVSLDDLRTDESRLLAVARLVLADIVQAFGTPELRQVTADGALRIRHFAGQSKELAHWWIRERDIPVSDEVLPDTY